MNALTRSTATAEVALTCARRRRSRWLLAITSVVATLLGLEGSIRIYDAVRGRSWNARTYWYWAFEQDPFTGFRGRANARIELATNFAYRHNEEGFRDDRTLHQITEVRGNRLVLCVGESSTYGLGAPSSGTAYPARLEVHLRHLSGDANWFVYNAGIPAYTSHQVVQLLRLRLLKYRPEVVVMMNLRNDVEFMARRVDEATDFGDLPLALAPIPSPFLTELAMRSSLFGLLATRVLRPVRPDGETATPAGPITSRGRAFYLDNLALAALVCRRTPTQLLLVDQPIFNEGYEPSRRKATAEMREAMKATARENDVPLLEADRPLHVSGFASPNEVHLGPVGYDKLAEILAPQVLEALRGRTPR